jgi:hypothetical protein
MLFLNEHAKVSTCSHSDYRRFVPTRTLRSHYIFSASPSPFVKTTFETWLEFNGLTVTQMRGLLQPLFERRLHGFLQSFLR